MLARVLTAFNCCLVCRYGETVTREAMKIGRHRMIQKYRHDGISQEDQRKLKEPGDTRLENAVRSELASKLKEQHKRRFEFVRELSNWMLEAAKQAHKQLGSHDAKHNLAKCLAVAAGIDNKGKLDNSPDAVLAVELMEDLWQSGNEKQQRRTVYVVPHCYPRAPEPSASTHLFTQSDSDNR